MNAGNSIVAEVKQRTDIVEVIGQTVRLRQQGDRYVGLCPFHTEKTPSFHVNRQRGFFHCFGCSEGGSVIDFVMKTESLEFSSALRRLADRLGIVIDKGRPQANTLFSDSTQFFTDNLLKAKAVQDYLKQRQFSSESWVQYELGYALSGWSGWHDWANAKGIAIQQQLESGLIIQGKKGGHYDRFRDRIMFPIKNTQGQVIAFGGRACSATEQAKYINSPNTANYTKKRALFGLYEALAAIRETGIVIVTEGYFDVMRLALNGLQNVVATCGTAISSEHIELLKNYAEKIILVLDGDAAGIKSSVRAAPIIFSQGASAKVVELPSDSDPDEFIRDNGVDKFIVLLEQAQPLFEFILNKLIQQYGQGLEANIRAMQDFIPVIEAMKSATARELAIRYAADRLGIRADEIYKQIASSKSSDTVVTMSMPRLNAPLAEQKIHHIILNYTEQLQLAQQLLEVDDFTNQELAELFALIVGQNQLDPEQLINENPEQATIIRQLLLDEHWQYITDPEKELLFQAAQVKKSALDRIKAKLRTEQDTEKQTLLMKEYVELRKSIYKSIYKQ